MKKVAKKELYFDLDGTLYDLYAIPNWLQLLRGEKNGAYLMGNSTCNLQTVKELCETLIQNYNYDIGVITWLAKYSSKEYEKRAMQEKLMWIESELPFVSEKNIFITPYGTPKQNFAGKNKKAILFDDNEEIIKNWETPKLRKGIKINSGNEVIENLYRLINEG